VAVALVVALAVAGVVASSASAFFRLRGVLLRDRALTFEMLNWR
jgi:hypothetical protein